MDERVEKVKMVKNWVPKDENEVRSAVYRLRQTVSRLGDLAMAGPLASWGPAIQ